MSSDKHKLRDRAIALILNRPCGIPVNFRGWPQFHKPSDNPEYQYLIDNGYATLIRKGEFRHKMTWLQPTEKWLKLINLA